MEFPRQLIPTDSRAGRMLRAGNVKVTVTSKATGQHITVEFAARRRNPEPGGRKWVPTGPDEATHIFVNAGRWDRVGTLRRYPDGWAWYPSKYKDSAREWAAMAAMRWVCGIESEQATFKEADLCGRCGRELTDPESIARGIGPECFGKMTESQHQRKQADQLPLDRMEVG